mmetsp:Transcript_5166/g.11257  ORF Transcript_5166/g.11257 Transcript_5166/m.11257 type:complete len:95 (-) Transcript_5166:762-1046(-)|eukprot:3570417-Pleurochrysis_carterae.AAC.1
MSGEQGVPSWFATAQFSDDVCGRSQLPTALVTGLHQLATSVLVMAISADTTGTAAREVPRTRLRSYGRKEPSHSSRGALAVFTAFSALRCCAAR